jgi:hypothetical protein
MGDGKSLPDRIKSDIPVRRLIAQDIGDKNRPRRFAAAATAKYLYKSVLKNVISFPLQIFLKNYNPLSLANLLFLQANRPAIPGLLRSFLSE